MSQLWIMLHQGVRASGFELLYSSASQEIEALCQGWHPLFRKEDIVVLDGSEPRLKCERILKI